MRSPRLGRVTGHLQHPELFVHMGRTAVKPKKGKGTVMWKLVAFSVITVSAAVWAVSASAQNSPRVFSVLDAPPSTDLPMGDFGFENPPVGGDQFAFVHTLYKWAGTKQGARVGHLQVVVTFVTGFGPRFTQRASVLINAQAYLPGGTVMVEGYGKLSADGPARLTLPVVGGTGIYANARGQVRVRDLGNGNINKSNITFHLLP